MSVRGVKAVRQTKLQKGQDTGNELKLGTTLKMHIGQESFSLGFCFVWVLFGQFITTSSS